MSAPLRIDIRSQKARFPQPEKKQRKKPKDPVSRLRGKFWGSSKITRVDKGKGDIDRYKDA